MGTKMMGGFRLVVPGISKLQEDPSLPVAVEAVKGKLFEQYGDPKMCSIHILQVESQVVAGVKYRLVIQVDDTRKEKERRYCQCDVWVKLPAYGGEAEIVRMHEINESTVNEQMSGLGRLEDPDVDQVVSYVLEQVSSGSNSMHPYYLKRLDSCDSILAYCDKNEDCSDLCVLYHVKMHVAAGNMADEYIDVHVRQKNHGFAMV